MPIKFSPKRQHGVEVYFTKDGPYTDDGYGKYSVIKNSGKYYIRIRDDRVDGWVYPAWTEALDGFRTIKDAENFLNRHDYEASTSTYLAQDPDAEAEHYNQFEDAMQMLGFTSMGGDDSHSWIYEQQSASDPNDDIVVRCLYYTDDIVVNYWVNGRRLPASKVPKNTSDIAKTIRNIETVLTKHGYEIFSSFALIAPGSLDSITAAIKTKDLMKNLVRVKSSNVWSIGMNVRKHGDNFGDMLMQFKGKDGGPGDIYIYYDVKITDYRKLVGSTSKGHSFWVLIRNNYKYSKLTGDKRGKLPNAINNVK